MRSSRMRVILRCRQLRCLFAIAIDHHHRLICRSYVMGLTQAWYCSVWKKIFTHQYAIAKRVTDHMVQKQSRQHHFCSFRKAHCSEEWHLCQSGAVKTVLLHTLAGMIEDEKAKLTSETHAAERGLPVARRLQSIHAAVRKRA